MRFVVDFNEAEPAQLRIHSGVSGNPSSDHYRDEIKLLLKGENNPMPVDGDAPKWQYAKVLVQESGKKTTRPANRRGEIG